MEIDFPRLVVFVLISFLLAGLTHELLHVVNGFVYDKKIYPVTFYGQDLSGFECALPGGEKCVTCPNIFCVVKPLNWFDELIDNRSFQIFHVAVLMFLYIWLFKRWWVEK